jgi:protein ImuB
MRIPSYDDLTPAIPDIGARDTLAQVNRILPRREAETRAAVRPDAAATGGQLFACLRSTRPPGVMMAIAREFSPRVERHGACCVVLDVSGLGCLLGDAQAIGDALAAAADDRVSGIRVAVAPTQTAARLMAIVHPRLVVLAGDIAAALADVPVRALRVLIDDGGTVPGDAGARAAARAKTTDARLETFHRWGLTTLGEVAALPSDALFERMGQEGLLLQRLARGADAGPLVPDPGTPRFMQSIELEWPVEALEPLSFVLARLLDPLSEALERADRGAAALRLDLRLVDRSTFARVLQLPAAMRDPRVLRTLLLLDLESHPPSAAIDIVTIEIDPAPARIIQYSLLERALPSAETLATLTARLGALVGDTRCGSPALLDTHRPDGIEMRRFAPESRVTAGRRAPRLRREAATAGRAEARPDGAASEGGWSRAEARPDGAASEGGRVPSPGSRIPNLRRFRPPIAVRVTVARGRPVHVAIDRRGMPGGDVEQQAGPWRTSGAWWDSGATAWDRDEWDVALTDGAFCRLYRDRAIDRWFLEGVFD